MKVDIPRDMSLADVADVIESSIAEQLGIHDSDVNVVVDSNGDVQFTIGKDSFDDIETIVNTMKDQTFVDKLSDEIKQNGITVNDIQPSTDITSDVEYVVDASEVISSDIVASNEVIENYMKESLENVNVEEGIKF